MASERFDFAGAQGQRLSGRLDLPHDPAVAYAVFAHCFTCSKASLAAVHVSTGLVERGYGVLRFDFTGLGQSDGAFEDSSFSGSVGDIAAAVRAMHAAGRPVRLLVGHSLGGAAVLAAAGSLDGVAAVATIGAPFDVDHVTRLFDRSLDEIRAHGEAQVDLGGRRFRIRRDFLEDLAAQDQGARIAALGRALLVLHSPQDRVVDVGNAGLIFAAAAHPRSFVALDGADHLLSHGADARYAADVIAAWASRYVDAPAPVAAATHAT